MKFLSLLLSLSFLLVVGACERRSSSTLATPTPMAIPSPTPPAEKGMFEKAGEKMDEGMERAGEKIEQGLDKAGEKIEQGLDKTGEKLREEY